MGVSTSLLNNSLASNRWMPLPMCHTSPHNNACETSPPLAHPATRAVAVLFRGAGVPKKGRKGGTFSASFTLSTLILTCVVLPELKECSLRGGWSWKRKPMEALLV